MYKQIFTALCLLLSSPNRMLISKPINGSKNGTTVPSGTINYEKQMASIIDDHYDQVLNLRKEYSKEGLSEKYHETLDELTKSTIIKLNHHGFESYFVDANSINNVSKELSTDLSFLTTDKNEKYIVTVYGEPDCSPKSTPSSSFQYTYEGTVYTLRYLTVTAADYSGMGKASSINLINSTVASVINHCLNAAVQLYIGSLHPVLGTISTICGVQMSFIKPNTTTVMNLNCATAWTGIFTQVWNSYDGMWQRGSYVERANCRSYVSGYYYSASSNMYTAVPQTEEVRNKYSTYYSNTTWRIEKAIYYGYLHSMIQYDSTGPAKYYYDNVLKCTHNNTF